MMVCRVVRRERLDGVAGGGEGRRTCGLTSTRKARQCCTAAYIALATAAAYPLAAGASVLHTSAAPPWEGEATGSRPPPDGAAHERETTCAQRRAGGRHTCVSAHRHCSHTPGRPA